MSFECAGTSKRDCLHGFDPSTKAVEDEPRFGTEAVLTLQLKVESDLGPSWRRYSAGSGNQGIERNLAWRDRAPISPTRIRSDANTNLMWSRDSVLNRLAEDRAALDGAFAGRPAIPVTTLASKPARSCSSRWK